MDFIGIKTELYYSAVRSRGPGGQNVNKVSSAAILFWDFSHSRNLSEFEKIQIVQKLQNYINKENQIYLRSDEFRDLEKNKNRCIEKLEKILHQAFFKPKARHKTKPTRSSKLKKQQIKNRRSETKKLRQKIKF